MLERYTSTFMDGEAYIGINKLHMSSQETEVCGAPIQRFAQYEATGVLPIEVYIQRQKLREYMLLGSPEYSAILSRERERACGTGSVVLMNI